MPSTGTDIPFRAGPLSGAGRTCPWVSGRQWRLARRMSFRSHLRFIHCLLERLVDANELVRKTGKQLPAFVKMFVIDDLLRQNFENLVLRDHLPRITVRKRQKD